MYTNRELPDELLVERLTALEEELDRPIRCLYGGATPSSVTVPWVYPDHTTGDASRGITLGLYCTRASDYMLRDLTISAVRNYDVMQPDTTPASPITVDDVAIGEVHPMVVYEYIGQHRNAVDGSIHEALIAGLRLCCDEQFIAEAAQREEAARRQALEEFVRSTYNGKLRDTRNGIDENVRSLAMWQQRVAEITRMLREQQTMLDALLLVQSNDSAETILREWEQLEQHGRVESLDFRDGKIVILTTDDLRLTRNDTGESRWLGQFRVEIDPAAPDITLHNLSTQRNGRDHPHVIDGNPCFGGHDSAFYELLGQGELYTVFELLIQYLETLNQNDEYGRYGSYWFEVADERPLEVVA